MAKNKSQTIADAEAVVEKDQRTLQREKEDAIVAELEDNPENINHLMRMGRHADAQRMHARYLTALAAE